MKKPHSGDRASLLELNLRSWSEVVLASARRMVEDRLSFAAAGAAFYGLLSLVPWLVGLLLLAVQWVDSRRIGDLLSEYSPLLPAEVRELLLTQLDQAREGAELHLVIGTFLLAMYGASRSVRAVIHTLNLAYGEEESRSFWRVQVLVLTLSALALLGSLFLLFALLILPAALAVFGERLLSVEEAKTLEVMRWVMLWVFTVAAAALAYRYVPSRPRAQWRFIVVGATLAASGWLLISVGFTLYARHFAQYGETYGALGTAVVLLLWLWLSAGVLLFGAVLNAELEKRTGSSGDRREMQL